MSFKINDVQRDLPKLNIELTRIDQHQQDISDLRKQVGTLKLQLQNEQSQIAPVNPLNQNNMNFIWTGGTTTVSWAAGYVKSNGHYIPIPAGSFPGLTASEYYWVAWNPAHQQMSFQTNLDAITKIHTLLIICQIFTGTGAQTGSAGGGGSEPHGIGITGKQYKLF